VQPETPQINPYGAPQAPVGDYVAGDHAVLERARNVPADHGVAWYREAWRLFKLSPGVWIGIWAAFTGIVILVSIPPVIGGLIVGVMTPLLVGGTMIAARNADREGGARFTDLFAAFTGRAGTLLLIGLLQLALTFIAGILIVMVGGIYVGSMFAGSMSDPNFDQMFSADVMVPMAVLGVVAALIFVPITNAVWLASGLAALEGASALDALRRAFSATYRNLLPLLVFVLVTIALAVVATIPLALGWLVLGPVILCAIYAQYKDLFDATEAQSGSESKS
jgi:hypothetical protein